ncbi:hypothetical protein IE81DRAFT_331949 [Ceraceosorus guamensis]|uniref:Uncharacterized protein n=1 Tax=Ceraceosorus guamensis TaxID=1522189 RepID=A0A316VRJ6_9BASI|nr:hypothetical protein IE81DRAFT_331949 [Ceraceosorus guamensis]PWN39980.1 hypothetical protein IE81DRAFT_331949 [Ceraceosorus guamensis]
MASAPLNALLAALQPPTIYHTKRKHSNDTPALTTAKRQQSNAAVPNMLCLTCQIKAIVWVTQSGGADARRSHRLSAPALVKRHSFVTKKVLYVQATADPPTRCKRQRKIKSKLHLIGAICSDALPAGQLEHLTHASIIARGKALAAAFQSPSVVWHQVKLPTSKQQKPSPLSLMFEQYRATVAVDPTTTTTICLTVCHGFSLKDALTHQDHGGTYDLDAVVERACKARRIAMEKTKWKKSNSWLNFNGGLGQPEYNFCVDKEGLRIMSQRWSQPLQQRHKHVPNADLPASAGGNRSTAATASTGATTSSSTSTTATATTTQQTTWTADAQPWRLTPEERA